MKKVKRAYYEVSNEYSNSIYTARKFVWSTKEANQIKARPGFHYEVARPNEPWHWETESYQEAFNYIEKHLNKIPGIVSNPFLRISPEEFRFLDIRGDINKPLSCTIVLSGGNFQKHIFLH